MKFLSYFLILCVSLLFSCDEIIDAGEGRWGLIYNQSDGIWNNSISFSNRSTGWICGTEGTIKKTTDGGRTWTSQVSGTVVSLWDISFINETTGWICGANNTVLKTEDGGKTWIDLSQKGPANRIFILLKFTDAGSGWITSNYGELLKTTDGGVSWELKRSGNVGAFRLTVFNLNTVYVMGRKLYKTFDGGATWDSVVVTRPYNFIPTSMSFFDLNNGWLVSDNTALSVMIVDSPVLYTTDGGAVWKHSQLVKDRGLSCIYFTDKNNGWVAGIGNIYKSVDGGNHWKSDFTLSRSYIFPRDIYFADKSRGWLKNYKGDIFKYSY